MSLATVQKKLSGFSGSIAAQCPCVRPERLTQLGEIIKSCAEEKLRITPRGCGWSYGDASIGAEDSVVVDVSRLNRYHYANWESGEIVVEPGLTFRDLIEVSGPLGWLPPVTPGLSDISLGGAFAMDIHGKNHRAKGGFSRSVKGIDLRLANGTRLFCSRQENQDLFCASIGGVGRTGIVERLHLQLEPSTGASVSFWTRPTMGIDEAIECLEEHASSFSAVYWGDLLNAKRVSGLRGAVIVSETVQPPTEIDAREWGQRSKLPLQLISPFYNDFSNKIFNLLYRSRLRGRDKGGQMPLRAHSFTWDALKNWNQLYGARGFFEYQFVVPRKNLHAIEEVLELVLEERTPCYLFAMKLMQEGEGLLSYGVRDGVSVLFDVPARDRSARTLDKADRIVAAAGGRVHLAKDSRLNTEAFRELIGPQADEFMKIVEGVDPDGRFASALTVRLGLDSPPNA